MNETERAAPKKGRGKLLLLLLLLILLIAAGVGGWYWWQSQQDTFFDVAAMTGHLPGKTEEEIQAELNRVVEEGMFNIAINTYLIFPDGNGEGLANIENIAANRYNMTVQITLDSTGETVYQSKGIRPGQYIQYIRLSEDLPAGVYNATAVFTAHMPDDEHSIAGQAGAKLVLEVEN